MCYYNITPTVNPVWIKTYFIRIARHTFAQISSIEPDVNEKVFDEDKAFFSLSI